MEPELKTEASIVLAKAIEDAKERKRLAEESEKQKEEQKQQEIFASNLPIFLEKLQKAIGQELTDIMSFEPCPKAIYGVKATFSYCETDFELWRWIGTHTDKWCLRRVNGESESEGIYYREDIPHQFFNDDRLLLAIDKLYNS